MKNQIKKLLNLLLISCFVLGIVGCKQEPEDKLDILDYVYMVKFESNGGTEIKPQTVVYGKKVTLPTNPSKEKFVFEGWYTDKDCTKVFNFDTEIKKDITLYAGWKSVYTVSFDANGGILSGPETQSVVSGEKATEPTNPSKEKFVFEDWYTDKECTKVYNFDTEIKSDITLYAGWKSVYTVSFDANGGILSGPETQSVISGEKATKPTNPSKEKFVFEDWYTDKDCTKVYNFDTEIKKDITLYAGWKSVYTVSFDANGGILSGPETQSVISGEKATLPSNPSKENYAFLGWYTDKDCTKVYNFDTEIKSDITLYAGWKSVYTVSFDANGGILSGPETQSVISGEKATVPSNPSKGIYVFDGWYTDTEFTNKYNFDLVVENSFTLYAKWFLDVEDVIQNIGTSSSSNASDYTICEFTSEKQGFYYAIELTEGTYYKIETTDYNRFLSGRRDAKFYLYDKDGNQEGYTDDGTIPFTPSYTGLYYIYMTPYSSGTGEAGVHVYIPTLISNLSFDTTSVSLKTNEYIDIIATWEPSDADTTYINYYSSRSGVASCSSISSGNGYRKLRIYGIFEGEATITLEDDASGLYTTCTVNVSLDEDAIINVDSSSIGTTSSVTESDYTICEFTSEKQSFIYAIELTEGTSYIIETTDSNDLSGRRDARFYLYDKDGNQKKSTDDDTISFTPSYTGLYYIYMKPYSNGSTGKAGFHIYTE